MPEHLVGVTHYTLCMVWVMEFRDYQIASETIFAPRRCSSKARRQSFTCMNIYPFCSLHRSYTALISQAMSFADEACKTKHLLGRMGKLLEDSGEFFLFQSVCNHLASFNMSPVYLYGGFHGCPSSNAAS